MDFKKYYLEEKFKITKTYVVDEIDDDEIDDFDEFGEIEAGDDELTLPDSDEPEYDLDSDTDEFSDGEEFGDDGDLDSNTDEFGDDDGLDSDTDEFEDDEDDDDYQGIIRNVRGAKLVYKRKQPDQTYEELWIFTSTKDMNKDMMTKRYILSGTDIDPRKNFSEDGKQKAKLTTIGNVHFLEVIGLPN